jgi:RNA polymerase sigma-70 factor (ECF subfamily)
MGALEKLCRSYWYPLYAFARRQGRSPEDAQDLTQGFFARLLEQNIVARADQGRGRFRTFLLASFRNFMANEWDRARADKRGGGRSPVSWDAQSAESRYAIEPADPLTPDVLFEKSWAVATLDQGLARLREQYVNDSKGEQFEALMQFLWEEQNATTYAELARRLAMNEPALRMAVMRLRRRAREALRETIAHTGIQAEEVEDELNHLLAVLRS